MSVIVRCKCGRKLRVAETRLGLPMRCPRCSSEFVAQSESEVVTFSAAPGATAGNACPVCQTEITQDDIIATCPTCQQTHHRECWLEVGGCGTYGCAQAPVLNEPASSSDPPRSAWGDTKSCPACGEKIKAIALRCRYCGTDFDTVDPLSLKDLRRKARKQDRLKTFKILMVALFVASLIGCFAPMVLIASIVLFIPKRETAAKAGPLFLVLGYAALIISLVWSLMIIGFVVAELRS